jgi:hypothetical protein
MAVRLCPLCHSKLTEEHYHKVLGIYAERKKAERALRTELAETKQASRRELENLRHRQVALKQQLASEKQRLREEKRREVAAARHEAKRTLDAKVKQAVGRAAQQIEKLKHENDRLRRGQSLGDAGLQTETEIYNLLRQCFPEDEITHTGKGGDVLHVVIRHKKPVGTIVYEVKDTQKLQASHIRQACDAMRIRKADFGVLVTNGTRQNFSGFHIERGVILVRPGGLLAAAEFLRNHLVQVSEAYLRASQKNVAGKRLLEYMSGRDFRAHMTTYIEVHRGMHEQLKSEVKTHVAQWKERDAMQRRLFTATHLLQGSVENLLVGKSPLKAATAVPPILLLPAR